MPSALTAPKALLGIKSLPIDLAKRYLVKALQLKEGTLAAKSISDPQFFSGRHVPNVALLFFESSTRTRFSFELAAKNLKLNTVFFAAEASTSMSKGESAAESLSTIMSMRPDLLVVRHSGDPEVQNLLAGSKIPVINAGDGRGEHPTQALLDAMTIIERLEIGSPDLKNQRILFVGDVDHSRVARSGLYLFQKLGAEVAVCCPPELLPQSQDWAGVQQFLDIQKAAAWCTVCIGLRLQKERHDKEFSLTQEEYVKGFRLDAHNLKNLSANGLIMHPGPFLAGIDLDPQILNDQRCVIREQVENGVFVRMVIIGELLGLFGS